MDPCGSSGGVFYQGHMSNLEPSDSQEHENNKKNQILKIHKNNYVNKYICVMPGGGANVATWK
jgi:hypothetical protein